MGAFRTVLLTGDGLRHKWVAHSLSTSLDLIGVVRERKRSPVEQDVRGFEGVVGAHLEERRLVEERMLGAAGPVSAAALEVPTGQINSAEVFEQVKSWDPDVVVVYGTGIIRQPLLSSFDRRLVNIHLGLSPYYRGAGTNLWPLVDAVPECVGATIHLIEAEVDAGPILHQVRPQPQSDDRAHELGTRALMDAGRVVPGVLAGLIEGTIEGVPQDLTVGKVYRRRDFTEEAVRKLWENLDNGMMIDYVAEAVARQAKFPIITAANLGP